MWPLAPQSTTGPWAAVTTRTWTHNSEVRHTETKHGENKHEHPDRKCLLFQCDSEGRLVTTAIAPHRSWWVYRGCRVHRSCPERSGLSELSGLAELPGLSELPGLPTGAAGMYV